MIHFDQASAHGRPVLDPQATLQDVLDSLLGRLDAVQRRAFHEKMMQLDGTRSSRNTPVAPGRLTAGTAPVRSSPWLC